MHSSVCKRSVVVGGHNTSVSLEDEFWQGLREIASVRHTTLSKLLTEIELNCRQSNLSSQIRVFVFDYYRTLRERTSLERDGALSC